MNDHWFLSKHVNVMPEAGEYIVQMGIIPAGYNHRISSRLLQHPVECFRSIHWHPGQRRELRTGDFKAQRVTVQQRYNAVLPGKGG
ncbi:hypothetical protein D3C73_1146460 [compost metagenome]